MRKSFWLLICMILSFVGCVSKPYADNPHFIPESVVEDVNRHVVSIAVYYSMGEEEYNRRLEQGRVQSGNDGIYWKIRIFSDLDRNLYKEQIVIPLEARPHGDIPVKVLAYIGSGIVVKDNHIVTVDHLLAQDENTYTMTVWVYTQHNQVQASVAKVVARTGNKNFFDDYAVIAPIKDLGLKGLKIARSGTAKEGDLFFHSGSVGGIHAFIRYGFLTDFHRFFIKGSDGGLKLGYHVGFPWWVCYPGGPGDSGGVGITISGEIFTVFYCGTSLYDEEYIFANPTQMLWDFLRAYGLLHLAR